MSDNAPTPWGHGGSGAPEGDDWVWAFSPTDPETGYSEEDTRLFHAPKEVAAEVVQAVNAYKKLTAELTECKRRLAETEKQRDVLRWAADGFVASVEDAGRHARRPRGGQQVPFHGDFAGVQPSALGRLEWWAKRFKDVSGFEYVMRELKSQLEKAQRSGK